MRRQLEIWIRWKEFKTKQYINVVNVMFPMSCPYTWAWRAHGVRARARVRRPAACRVPHVYRSCPCTSVLLGARGQSGARPWSVSRVPVVRLVTGRLLGFRCPWPGTPHRALRQMPTAGARPPGPVGLRLGRVSRREELLMVSVRLASVAVSVASHVCVMCVLQPAP